ncbi:MAG TPA: PQQ-dependent sugar dehydrogenase [Xanthomonadales bacterium]|nr:PQQ-dependent sugar dehydrogenase [Xanthomonadales bacterium]
MVNARGKWWIFRSRGLLLLLWQLGACAAFVLAGAVLLGLPPWLFGWLDAVQLGILCLAYVLSTVVPLACALLRIRWHPALNLVLAAVFFGCAWVYGHLSHTDIPPALAIQLGIVCVLLNGALGYLSKSDRSRWLIRAVGALAIAIALIAVPGLAPLRHSTLAHVVYRALEEPRSRVVDTALHRVQINIFRGRIPLPEALGGGLAVADEKLLLVTGDGLFYLLELSADSERLTVQALDYTVPANSAEFQEDTKGSFGKENFRVLGIQILDGSLPGQKHMLVSHHYWHREKACYVVRVSAALIPWPDFQAGSAPPGWRTLYETTPCLSLKSSQRKIFVGHQSGGRMIQTGPAQILLTVGDHGYDGFNAAPAVAQDMAVAYGKTIEIDTGSGEHRIFTSGHRNPQGLHRDSEGRIWLTEHGPKGGDELNLLRSGGNYGWPVTTLGADYEGFSWPPATESEPSPDFIEPVFAWTPSIAVTALTHIEGGDFERWQGDLIAASLKARSIYRIHLVRDQAIMAEPMVSHERTRDIVRDSAGRIVFWTDRAAVGVLKRAAEED